MSLPFFIARRYLFARKSHNVINIISAISAIGMAVGTAALVICLSIYNGFDSFVISMMGNVEADLCITPARGKTFVPDGEVYDWLYDNPSVKNMFCVLQEQVFLNYDGKQAIAQAKGVDEYYCDETPLRDCIVEGEAILSRGDVPMAWVGSALAHKLGLSPRFVSPLEIYYPSRTRKLSLSSPMSSVEYIKVWPSAVFAVNKEVDENLLVLPLNSMRELLEYDNEVSAVEVRFVEGVSARERRNIKKTAASLAGESFRVKDRFEQNESLYKMMKYEKAAVYLVLIFIIIIVAFNIFGSLSMLIIEKKDDIRTLRSLGATDKLIMRIFTLEGWGISLLGLFAGLAVGVSVSLLQQHFGFVKMPGASFLLQAYPVVVSVWDLLLVCLGVGLTGYIIARLPVRAFIKKHSDHE